MLIPDTDLFPNFRWFHLLDDWEYSLIYLLLIFVVTMLDTYYNYRSINFLNNANEILTYVYTWSHLVLAFSLFVCLFLFFVLFLFLFLFLFFCFFCFCFLFLFVFCFWLFDLFLFCLFVFALFCSVFVIVFFYSRSYARSCIIWRP